MSIVLQIYHCRNEECSLIAEVQEPSFTVGRTPEINAVVLDFPTVSGTHGQLLQHDGIWFYQDLRSTNGSWGAEGQLEAFAPYLIRNGTQLAIGSEVVKFSLTEAEHLNDPLAIAFWDKKFVASCNLANNQTYSFGGSDSLIDDENFNQRNFISCTLNGADCQINAENTSNTFFLNGREAASGHNYILRDRGFVSTSKLRIVFHFGQARESAEDVKFHSLIDNLNSADVDMQGKITTKQVALTLQNKFGAAKKTSYEKQEEDSAYRNTMEISASYLQGVRNKNENKDKFKLFGVIAAVLILIILLVILVS